MSGPQEVCLEREVLGRTLTARALRLAEGVRVDLYGGDKPHIGAVSVAGPEGRAVTTEFPTHREGIVAGRWAGALAAAGFRPAVVSCGIHYDHITPEQIRRVLEEADLLLEQLLAALAPTA